MKIKSVTLDNFRCFKRLEINFSKDLTVLVAANGQGKTAILEALTYLLGIMLGRFPQIAVPKLKYSDFRDEWISDNEMFQNPTWHPVTRASFMRLTGVTNDGKSWDTTMKRDASATTLKDIPAALGGKEIIAIADHYIDMANQDAPPSEFFPVFAYYDTERAVIRKKPERRRNFRKVFNRFDGYREALDGQLNYKKMIEWFCFLEDKQNRVKNKVRDWDYQTIEQKTIQEAVGKMLPGFRNLRTHVKPLDLIVDVEEGDSFKSCCIDSQLSDGYKIVLVLALDLVSRILELNADIPTATPENLLQVPGIVLIDEVDLHLHPSWQQRIIGDLQRTFPNIQFIVTTHSPQVVSSVPMECVRVIADGQVFDASIKTDGARADQVLEAIFGVNARYTDSPVYKDLMEFQALLKNGEWDSVRGQTLYEKLRQSLSTDPILADFAMRIHLKEYQRRH